MSRRFAYLYRARPPLLKSTIFYNGDRETGRRFLFYPIFKKKGGTFMGIGFWVFIFAIVCAAFAVAILVVRLEFRERKYDERNTGEIPSALLHLAEKVQARFAINCTDVQLYLCVYAHAKAPNARTSAEEYLRVLWELPETNTEIVKLTRLGRTIEVRDIQEWLHEHDRLVAVIQSRSA